MSGDGYEVTVYREGRPVRFERRGDRPPRRPGDGTCGCTRVRDGGKWVVELCAEHQAEAGIRDFVRG